MTTKRSALGKNLSALLGQGAFDLTEKNALLLKELPLSLLSPGAFQPRSPIDESSLVELVDSIRQQGVLQPIIVRSKSDGHYEIIAGERRFRASRLAGRDTIPCIVKVLSDDMAMAIALIENLQRKALNPMEEALALSRLIKEFQMTHQDIADVLSTSRAGITNYLRLLTLSDEVKPLLAEGLIHMGHARALLTLSPDVQLSLAKEIIEHDLSVREAEKRALRLKSPQSHIASPDKKTPVSPIIQDEITEIATKWQTKIELKPKANGKKGALVIHYEDEAKMMALLLQLKGVC